MIIYHKHCTNYRCVIWSIIYVPSLLGSISFAHEYQFLKIGKCLLSELNLNIICPAISNNMRIQDRNTRFFSSIFWTMNVVEQIFWNLVAVRSGLAIERIKKKKNIVKIFTLHLKEGRKRIPSPVLVKR